MYSSIFALCVAYTIWYAAVRKIGSARTAIYSNLLPVIAMVTAYVWLREPIGLTKLSGAAAVLAGVALTRSASAKAPARQSATAVRQS
jgi:drug/metabolite transporter (DMT)-like permease